MLHSALGKKKKRKEKKKQIILIRPLETLTGAVLLTKASSKLVHVGQTGSLTTTTMVAQLSQINITKNLS